MDELKWCINYLKNYNKILYLPKMDNNDLFRSLMNITTPYDLSLEYYQNEAIVLKKIQLDKMIIDINDCNDGISLLKGDITLVQSDAIVNACNSKMLGCFQPLHKCVDNAIHSYAGLAVRRDMMKMMDEQGHDEENGKCKVTQGYNLPSKYIFHTVGPIYSNQKQDYMDLENCYLSCLKIADEMKLESIAFPSISTGIFGFPIREASKIAIHTAKEYLDKQNKNIKKVIFITFSEGDYNVYKERLDKTN